MTFTFHTSTLEMWPTTFEAQSWSLCGFKFIDHWCFSGIEISSGETLALSYPAPNVGTLLKQSWCYSRHFSVHLPCSLVYWNLSHTPWCNGWNLLQVFETCQLCDGFLIKVCWHNLGTFQVACQNLVENRQRLRWHDCWKVLLTIVLKAHFWGLSMSTVVSGPLTYGLK